MTLSRRGAAAAAGAPVQAQQAQTASTGGATVTRRPRSAAHGPAVAVAAGLSRDPEQREAYQHKSPTLLLSAFALSFTLVLYCLWSFLAMHREAQAAKATHAQMRQVQSLHARQQQLNQRSQHKWDLYAEQRGNVTSTLVHMRQLTLCILGAGNLNDVTLSALLKPLPEPAGVDQQAPPAADSEATSSDASLPRSSPASRPFTARGFSSLSLVDLDRAAMEAGLARQVSERGLDPRLVRPPRVRMHSADVTSSFERLSQWKREKVAHEAEVAAGKRAATEPSPSVAEVDAWIASLQTHPRPSHGGAFRRPEGLRPAAEVEVAVETDDIDSPSSDDEGLVEGSNSSDDDSPVDPASSHSDVVASVCLLSQLLDQYMVVVPDSHPRFLAGVLALRDAHVSLMLDLLRPGGWGVLITDVVASTTAPQLRSTPHEQLPALLPALVKAGNFFTGCNPRAIEARMHTHFGSELVAGSVHLMQPWQWRMGGEEDKRFLVYALAFRKAFT